MGFINWLFPKKKPIYIDLDKGEVYEPPTYTDEELRTLILDGLRSGMFQTHPALGLFIVGGEGSTEYRQAAEHQIRKQCPEDRAFWSLTYNPFFEVE